MNEALIYTVIEALEAVPPMSARMGDWDRESTTTVERSVGCPNDEARALWKILREQNIVELISDYNGPGFETNSHWRWRRLPKEIM